MKPVSLADLAGLINGVVIGDDSVQISTVAKIEEAERGSISFLANPRYEKFLNSTRASAVIVSKNFNKAATNLIQVDDPYLAFRTIVLYFYPFEEVKEHFVHATAQVEESAKIGQPVYIGANVVIEKGATIEPHTIISSQSFIGKNVKIGYYSIIHPSVTILHNCVLGDNVVIHSGTVIGSDGFGYARKGREYLKIPQIGNVVVGDFTEIGANCTIDRAAMGSTKIGKGCIIDNLVQIAHNISIGDYTAIAAQTGIAGSTKVGTNVIMGGQVGIVGHIDIGNNAILGAQAGVTKDIPENSYYFGYPARDHRVLKRIEACLTRLPELFKRVKHLENRAETK